MMDETPEDARLECEHRFEACAPYVRAECEAEEAIKATRAALRGARKNANAMRGIWVDFVLAHDHQAICRPQIGIPADRPEQPTVDGGSE